MLLFTCRDPPLPLGLEAPVMMPNGAIFLFFSTCSAGRQVPQWWFGEMALTLQLVTSALCRALHNDSPEHELLSQRSCDMQVKRWLQKEGLHLPGGGFEP